MLPFSFEAVIHCSSGSEKLNSFRLLPLSDALQNIMAGVQGLFGQERKQERWTQVHTEVFLPHTGFLQPKINTYEVSKLQALLNYYGP